MNESIQTGQIVGLTSNGQGIVRQAGLVTFIPYTAEGDTVEYGLIQHKKNFAIGRLLNILEPSPTRTIPLCQYFGTCGGCQLQHINYETQVAHKHKWIEDAFKKIGKFENISIPSVRPANLQWSYRRHINLVLRKNGEVYQAGYIKTDNKTLIAIENCSIFKDKSDPIIKSIQEISCQLKSNDPYDGKVTILKHFNRYIAHFHFREMPVNAFEIFSECLKTYPLLNGLLATSRKKSFQFGVLETTCEIDGLIFDFTPKTFIQNHPEQGLNIYAAIEKIAEQNKAEKVLDLYCGIGISTLLLARKGCRVKGVELNPQSIEQAKKNAIKNHLELAQFVIADVEQVLAQLLTNDQPDFIIVNPPREGLSPKVVQIIKSKPAKTLIYISCMPSTLARDLKLLCEDGYQIAEVQCFDMFPQTVHVETLVVLKSKSI